MLGMRKHEIRRSWRSLQEVTAVQERLTMMQQSSFLLPQLLAFLEQPLG